MLGIVNARLDSLEEKIIIKNGEIELEAAFYKTPIELLEGKFIYVMEYDGPDLVCYEHLRPFVVSFTDSRTGEINDNCYIQNFHKTFKYSGTQVICTVLKFLKVLGVKIARLFDASSVGDDHVSLSLIKLIEYGDTFYAKFGFDYSFSQNLVSAFGSKKNMDLRYKEAYNQISSILLYDIIRYHTSLLKIMSQIIYEESPKNLTNDVIIGKDVITYFVLPGGLVVKEGGIHYFKLLDIMNTSTDILTRLKRLDPNLKTLKDLVKYGVKEKDTKLLESVLSFRRLPLVIVSGRKVLKGDYIKPLVVLSAMSFGYRTLDLTKVKKIC